MDTPLPPSTVAAVDLGSNSFHMVVARRAADGGVQVVDTLRRTVRLAAGLDDAGALTEEAQTRALVALSLMGERVAAMPPGSVRAVGTNTLRKAKNSAEFLQRARAALGHPIDVISGREEARLIYLGVRHDRPAPGRRLVVDIGGGSTELIIGEGDAPLYLDSRYMGCVSWSMRFFQDGRITRKRFDQAVTAAQLGLESTAVQYQRLGWDEVIGSSGTIKAIERVLHLTGLGPDGITPTALAALRDALVSAGRAEALDLPGLSEHRRPVLAGGLSVLMGVVETLGVQHMTAASFALREGVLYDLLGRLAHRDVREETVARLAEQHGVDATHAARVERCALGLFDQVAAAWGLDPRRDRSLLSWAARLHEIGMSVAYTGYHKHGAYLLRNGDLPGFSRQEQGVLAALVLCHRGKLSNERIAQVHAGAVQQVLRLAVVLRLARRLHRTRAPTAVPTPTVDAIGRTLTLAFPTGYLADHPLLAADLTEEKRIWRRVGLRLRISDAPAQPSGSAAR